jgi:hypothetical protein
MQLPDIVVCPLNRFNRTYLASVNISTELGQFLEMSYPSPVIHRFQYAWHELVYNRLDELEDQLNNTLHVSVVVTRVV